MKYYTHQKPPVIKGEVSNKPSETRQSDDMDIKETIARFFRQGGVIPQQLGANDISAEEREQMFEGISEQELMDSDLSEQAQFVNDMKSAAANVSKTHETSVKKDVSPEKKEEKPTESAKAD